MFGRRASQFGAGARTGGAGGSDFRGNGGGGGGFGALNNRQDQSSDNRQQGQRQGQKPCQNWQRQGSCKFGSSCRYAHSNPVAEETWGNHRGGDICKNWSKGSCKFGDRCRYSHDTGGSRSFGSGSGGRFSGRQTPGEGVGFGSGNFGSSGGGIGGGFGYSSRSGAGFGQKSATSFGQGQQQVSSFGQSSFGQVQQQPLAFGQSQRQSAVGGGFGTAKTSLAQSQGGGFGARKEFGTGTSWGVKKESFSSNQASASSNTPCRNWQRDGACKYGASCRFSHDKLQSVDEEMSDSISSVGPQGFGGAFGQIGAGATRQVGFGSGAVSSFPAGGAAPAGASFLTGSTIPHGNEFAAQSSGEQSDAASISIDYTAEELAAFKANEFTIGQIPEVEPPQEVCR